MSFSMMTSLTIKPEQHLKMSQGSQPSKKYKILQTNIVTMKTAHHQTFRLSFSRGATKLFFRHNPILLPQKVRGL